MLYRLHLNVIDGRTGDVRIFCMFVEPPREGMSKFDFRLVGSDPQNY